MKIKDTLQDFDDSGYQTLIKENIEQKSFVSSGWFESGHYENGVKIRDLTKQEVEEIKLDH